MRCLEGKPDGRDLQNGVREHLAADLEGKVAFPDDLFDGAGKSEASCPDPVSVHGENEKSEVEKGIGTPKYYLQYANNEACEATSNLKHAVSTSGNLMPLMILGARSSRNGINWREILGQDLPGVASVARIEKRSGGSTEINSGRIAIVGSHRLAQNQDMRVGLRQALVQQFPGAAAVTAARDAELAFGDEAMLGRLDGDGEQGVLFGRGNGESEAKAARQTLGDIRPFLGGEVSLVNAAMVLLEKRSRAARMGFQLMDALANFGEFVG
jgi:hypothetical protein